MAIRPDMARSFVEGKHKPMPNIISTIPLRVTKSLGLGRYLGMMRK